MSSIETPVITKTQHAVLPSVENLSELLINDVTRLRSTIKTVF